MLNLAERRGLRQGARRRFGKKMPVKLSIILFAALISACRETASPIVNQAAKPVPTAAIAADKPQIRTGDGSGIITKINFEIGAVGLDHDEIKGVMPAMKGMEFYVSDKKMLDKLKVGDKVNFVLEDKAGAERIINIKKK